MQTDKSYGGLEPVLTINEAAEWASRFTKKNVTPSNITYLIQYGKIQRHQQDGKLMSP